MADVGVIGNRSRAACYGAVGINIGGSLRQSVLVFGAQRSDSDGNPAVPSLVLKYPGTFSFRWVVRPGTRSIRINAKQAINTGERPKLVVRGNTAIGVMADTTASAASSTGWVTVGPIVVTPTASGVLMVELVNGANAENSDGCFFDHIVTQ